MHEYVLTFFFLLQIYHPSCYEDYQNVSFLVTVVICYFLHWQYRCNLDIELFLF